MPIRRFPVLLYPGDDGYIVAECPVIPGCVTQGRDRDQALAHLREAIELCLDNREAEGWSLPERFEIVDLAPDPGTPLQPREGSPPLGGAPRRGGGWGA
jgi:predicted RNase H-like HicB family nuclease